MCFAPQRRVLFLQLDDIWWSKSGPFLDDKVFTPCKATPVQTVQQIRNSVPEWIFRHYAWGLDFSAKLSTGCSKRLDPLSTIAHRGRGSWAKPLVLHYWKYSTLFFLTFWNFRMYTPYLNKFVWCFKSLLLMNGHLKIHQSDIVGFYNQVEHDRILQAVDFALHRFFALQWVSLESSIQTHNHKLERTLRIFQSHWRSQSKQFREIKLAHIRDLVKFLLQNSFFHVGTQVFRQHRDASMGSQWAPILCSAVALTKEYKFFQVYPMLTIELIRRFSDSPGNNRLFCGLPHFGASVLL